MGLTPKGKNQAKKKKMHLNLFECVLYLLLS